MFSYSNLCVVCPLHMFFLFCISTHLSSIYLLFAFQYLLFRMIFDVWCFASCDITFDLMTTVAPNAVIILDFPLYDILELFLKATLCNLF